MCLRMRSRRRKKGRGEGQERAEQTHTSHLKPQIVINRGLATKRCLTVLEPIDLTCLLQHVPTDSTPWIV